MRWKAENYSTEPRIKTMSKAETENGPISRAVGSIYLGKNLLKSSVLSLEWKSEWVMDGESAEEKDGLR